MFPVVPNTVKLHRRGSCVPTVIACLTQLRDGRDHIIEGQVRFGNRGWRHEHTWMLVDGKIFDPALEQFRCLKSFSQDIRRENNHVIPVAEYRGIWAYKRSQWWFERCRDFGVPPSLCT